jgi:hypothetical protein
MRAPAASRLLAVLMVVTGGCGGSGTKKSLDGGFVNAPDGYVPPFFDAQFTVPDAATDARPASGGGFIDAGTFLLDGSRPPDALVGGPDASRLDAAIGGSDAAGPDLGVIEDALPAPYLDAATDTVFPSPDTGSGGSVGTGGAGGSGGSGTGGAGGSPDDGGVSPPTDGGGVPRPCAVALRPIGAASLQRLLAGTGAVSVIRAELAGDEPGSARSWSWSVFYQGAPAVFTRGTREQGVIRLSTERPGSYFIQATTFLDGSSCSGSDTAEASNPLATVESNLFRTLVLPPEGSTEWAPFTQPLAMTASAAVDTPIPLSAGIQVAISPVDPIRNRTIPSYVRISSGSRLLRLDGFAGTAPFTTRLIAGALYEVLVVPAAADGSGVGAPQAPLYQDGLEVTQLADPTRFRLDPGVPVRGRIVRAGSGQANTRVVLRGALLASTVASTASDGSFEVLVRPGVDTFVASPPADSGLPEVVMPVPASLWSISSPRIDLDWRFLATERVTVAIRAADGAPVAGSRVRVKANLAAVADAKVTDSVEHAWSPVAGVMRDERTSGADGTAVFPLLPRGDYTVTVVPAEGRPEGITTTHLVVSAGGPAVQPIVLAARVPLAGKLTGDGDLANIAVVATDVGSDVLVAPIEARSASDGSFTLSVSPGRRYLLLAHPPAQSAFARTQIGVGPVEATEFGLTHKMRPRIAWTGRVHSAQAPTTGIAGAVIKAYCYPGTIECADPTVPLAEAVSGSDGSFSTWLPDILRR